MEVLSLFSLAGKRALITGSSRGLGFAIAAALAGAGAGIILNSRDPEGLATAVAGLAGSGARAVAFDVTSADSIHDAVDYIERELGPIDVLVNAAGMRREGALEDFPQDRFERLLAANVQSVFLVSQATARHMIPRGAGKIINICSAAGSPSNAADAASRAAVARLTRSMAVEWGRHGLSVNGLAPGCFLTGRNDVLAADAALSAGIAERTPLRRLGRLSELGSAAVFLASEASSFVNGHILYVDGGLSAS